ncbi:phosphoenolpyruvate carboxykinase (ATP) [Alphaproteobacteria bacterium]|nr:phosphoenolpyruvate carboxykinase (ATP) [Alphaproteobacteria bacterium]
MDNSKNIIHNKNLSEIAIFSEGKAFSNIDVSTLYEHIILRKEGKIAEGGSLVVLTGEHTGRSAQDKFIVKEEKSYKEIWWGKTNKHIDVKSFNKIKERMYEHLKPKDLYVQDSWAGADPNHRIGVRVVTETAWHSLFAKNMFIEVEKTNEKDFYPDFCLVQSPTFLADPETENTKSSTFIIINFEQRLILIGGTSYAGEIKKSIFSIMNYLLPQKQILPMHCSVNTDQNSSAIFFGLSGTGKTTLSADSSRLLVGDDEHGWSEDGIFNFEGGCYAKVIKLDKEAEPEIFSTTKRFGTVLENVVMKSNRELNLDDETYTENTRASYPINFIPNIKSDGFASHPSHVIMLTADANGVFPPLSKLSINQAMYHFISGYTSKLAGTEKGLGSEPESTFSTCFGAPFMPRHPSVYADLLGKKLKAHEASCWLVNTGWTGGAYGVGARISIKYTRALLNAVIRGDLDNAEFVNDLRFGFSIPTSCTGVPTEILNPINSWKDKESFDLMANKLVEQFQKNFLQYSEYTKKEVSSAGPRKI